MELLIAITLWLFLAILTLVCLALITPIIVRIHMTTLPQFAYQVQVSALVEPGPFLTLADGPRQPTSGSLPAQRTLRAEKAKRRGMFWPKRGHGAVVQALPTLVRDIVHRVRLLKLHIDADYGLGDPAETGRLCGMLMPLQHAGRIPEYVSLNLRPDFTKPVVNGRLTVLFRVTMAELLVPITRFAWRAYGPKQ